MNGVCVIVEGRIVAWFESIELAEPWATENYFGQWLIVPAETAPVRASARRAAVLEGSNGRAD